ncbi:MAG: hypothetical protein WCP85_25160 [Mariniphaga sp.]
MVNDLTPLWEVLKIVLPALIVFLTAYFLLRDMLENSFRKREFEMRMKTSGQILPVRLQAYERLALVLERISPQSLLMRISPHDNDANDYQQQLLAQIRQEFEHNVSQQIYVSPLLWQAILIAKENLIGIINRSAEEVGVEVHAIVLSQRIIDNYVAGNDHPIIMAMDELKKEVGKMF